MIKFKEYYEKIMNTKWLVVILIIGIALMLLPSHSEHTAPKSETIQQSFVTDIDEYEKNLEKKLASMLSEIKGAKNVSVMITFSDYGKYFYSLEELEEKNETSSKGNQKPVLKDSAQGGEEPILIKAELPKITGVFITAEGAQNAEVRENITAAVKAVLNVNTKNISVLGK